MTSHFQDDCFNQELGDIPNFNEVLFCDIFPGGVKQAVEC